MRRLTIKSRLMLAIGFTALLLVGLGYIGLSGLERTVRGVDTVYKDRLIPTDQLWSVNDLMRANLQELLLAAQHDPRLEESAQHESSHSIAMHLDAVARNVARISELWAAYTAGYLTDEERGLVERYEQARTRFVAKGLEPSIELLRGRRFLDANMNTIRVALPAFREAKALVEELVKLQTRMAGQAYEAAQAEYRETRNWTAASILVGILMSAAASFMLMRAITLPLEAAITAADRIAAGDLTHRIEVNRSDESGRLLAALHKMNEELTAITSQVRAGTDSINSAVREIADGNSDLSQRTEAQAASLEQTASSMEQMTSTVRQNANNAQQANQLALLARERAQRGGQVVADAVAAMEGINAASRRIADIIGVIDSIAFQTNLLALNAAVEAARAGEQGRGFAVVAGEVRNLAQRTATAAKEIKGLIHDSVERVARGSELVTASGQTLEEILAAVRKVTDIVSEIASASREQSARIEQVNRAVAQMDESTQQNASLVEQAAAASRALEGQVRQLRELVGFFRTAAAPGKAVRTVETGEPAAVADDTQRAPS